MAHIFALCNMKGGVGKTSTAVNLAAFAARAGKRALIVDCDPQGHIASALAIRKSSLAFTLSEVVSGHCEIQNAIIEVRDNLFVLPGTESLALTEIELRDAFGREQVLQRLLDPIKSDYDVIFIDTSPAPNFLTVNALVAGDTILMPISTNLALESAGTTFELVKRLVAAHLVDKPDIYIVQTFYRTGVTECSELRRKMKEMFQDRLCDTKINLNTKLSVCVSEGRPITDYPSSMSGHIDYRGLWNEIAQIASQGKQHNKVSTKGRRRH